MAKKKQSNNPVIHLIPQRSEAWFAARAGLLTSSDAKAMLSKGRGSQPSLQRAALALRLAGERIEGKALDTEGYDSVWMQRGRFYEERGLAHYEAHTGQVATLVGLVTRPDLAVGSSPDALIDRDALRKRGGVEIKVPKTTTHLGYLVDGGLPKDYQAQVQHHLFVTGCDWFDFVSYSPELAPPRNLFICRVEREDVDLKAYELMVRMFLKEVGDAEETLKAIPAT